MNAINKPYTPSRGLNDGELLHWEVVQEGDGQFTVAYYEDGSTWYSGYRANGIWHDSYWTH